MITFDQILPTTSKILQQEEYGNLMRQLEWLLINRDLNGRVRLIAPESVEKNETVRRDLESLANTLVKSLSPHTSPTSPILYESDRERALQGAAIIPLEGHDNVSVVDRLAMESNWAKIAPETKGTPRIVFFSVKGGVGRSTVLAATAWWLAQKERLRVLVLDLDLESPGLSSSLLPQDRRPQYGITDWLVEDLVDNGDAVIENMIATSSFSQDGDIFIVPAHGADPGEYVAKLGRVWMPKIKEDGKHESWTNRLQRLLQILEKHIRPDVMLIDSRAGIDEVASACVTDLGAKLVMLFALEGSQTWSGYRILFEHWLHAGVVKDIRERLQIVSAMTPDTEARINYLETFRDNGYDLFAESLYDEIKAGEMIENRFHYDAADETAPHVPWEVRWNTSFAGLSSLHGRLTQIDSDAVSLIFGPVINGIKQSISRENSP